LSFSVRSRWVGNPRSAIGPRHIRFMPVR
jgi:hypothetical protein